MHSWSSGGLVPWAQHDTLLCGTHAHTQGHGPPGCPSPISLSNRERRPRRVHQQQLLATTACAKSHAPCLRRRKQGPLNTQIQMFWKINSFIIFFTSALSFSHYGLNQTDLGYGVSYKIPGLESALLQELPHELPPKSQPSPQGADLLGRLKQQSRGFEN